MEMATIVEEDIKEEETVEEVIKKEVITEELTTTEFINEEEYIQEEDIKKEVIIEEAITEELTTTEFINEEDIKEEVIKEEDVKVEVITEEYIKVGDIKEEVDIKLDDETKSGLIVTQDEPKEESINKDEEKGVDTSSESSTTDDEDAVQARKEEVHYISPTSPRTEYEGDFMLDYMQFLIRPFERAVSVSTSIASTIQCDISPVLQRTMAIIKPEAMEFKDVILRVIEEGGFQIVGRRHIHLSAEQVSEIYSKYYGEPMFAHLVVSMNVAPVLALSLAGTQAVNRWRKIVGPNCTLKEEWFYPISVRRVFGFNQTYETQPNVIHASENLKEANMENRYFYPNSILEPLMTDKDEITDFCKSFIYPTLTKGLLEVIKAKPIDPVMFLADWLLLNNPYQPRLPYHIALTST